MNVEVFKDIPGYEGLYSVSNKGRVYSQRVCRIMSPKKSKVGYLRITLCGKDGNRLSTGIHRLVALAFIPNPENKPTVNHINEVKFDNRVENLEWATNAEQNIHGTRIRRAIEHTDWKARNAKTDYASVAKKHDYQSQKMCNRYFTEVSKNGVVEGIFRSQKEASDYTGVSVSKVSQCVLGRRKFSKGYSFRRMEELNK